jgi:hypothetical protein
VGTDHRYDDYVGTASTWRRRNDDGDGDRSDGNNKSGGKQGDNEDGVRSRQRVKQNKGSRDVNDIS